MYSKKLCLILYCLIGKWGNFKKVIDKAVTSIESTNITVPDHIADVGKTIQMPKGVI